MSTAEGVSILARYLSDDKKLELALDLSSDLSNTQNISGLIEVLGSLDFKSVEVVSERVLVYVKELVSLKGDLSDIQSVLELLSQLPDVTQSLLQWLHGTISCTIQPRLNYLFELSSLEIFKKHGIKIESDSVCEIDVEYSLSFLERLLSLEIVDVPKEVDHLLLALLAINEEKTSTQASKTLRWRISSFSSYELLIWDLVFTLLHSSNTYTITNAFIQWLRFLINMTKLSATSDSFNHLIETNEYWKHIQDGLTSNTHDQKKYSLSILKLSVHLAKIDINNSLVSFNVSRKKEQTEHWERFCTLYEIVGVDTALNQAEAAQCDILEMLSPSSYIKPSWGMALLCTGFRANMESVRKFSMNLMYFVKKENLSIFAHEFFTDVFLKYSIEAPHFQVKRGEMDKLVCPYGEQLEQLVAHVLLSLKTETSILQGLVTKLLDLLVESTSIFAPSRIYLTSGIIKGLKGHFILTESNLKQVFKLFDSSAEDDAFQKYLQSLHLSFLSHLKPNVPLLLEGLNQFVLLNGYGIFYDSLEIFLDYTSMHHNGQNIEYKSRGPEYQVIYYALFREYDLESSLFLKELAHSGIVEVESAELASNFSKLLTQLITRPPDSNYNRSKDLAKLNIFKNSWSSVDLSALFQSVVNDHTESFNQDKFEFFEAVYVQFAQVTQVDSKKFQLTFEQVKQLFEILTGVGLSLKSKDNVIGSYLNILLHTLRMTPLGDIELAQVFYILQQSLRSAFYSAFIKILEILQYLFDNYTILDLVTAVEILESIWDFVTGDRLILNQKDMHLAFIETLFHPTLLRDSINNEFHSKTLRKIGLDIIAQSHTRRSFLPCLSGCLLRYHLGYRGEFEQTEWALELAYRILTTIQDESNLFRIKNVTCAKFDAEVSFEGNLYDEVFGENEISAKVNIISILGSSTPVLAESYWSNVIDSDIYSLITPKKKTDCAEEMERVYGYASLLLLSKKINMEKLSHYVSQTLLPALESESSPLVRSYMEWIIAIDMIQSPIHRPNLFRLFQNHNKPTLVTSVERIAFLICQKLNNDNEGFEFFDSFTKFLLPNCASNKPLIRHFSNSLCLSLYPETKAKEIKLPIDPVLLKLYEDAVKSQSTGKYRAGDALTWDVEHDFNLVAIFGGVLKRISPRNISVYISEEELKKYAVAELDVKIGELKAASWSEEDNSSPGEGPSTQVVNSTLQTKSGAWETVLDFDEQERSIKRTELIVVSSLVDKPPNLGGICRLCDVLGTGLMTVDDLRVTQHPQFKNVAVTADHWMPMAEVKIDEIVDFMTGKKKEGYTLIGLEQTDKSIVLGPETKFPIKSLFLLGREAEGIPGELLAELDYCIEIRQRGVIRSMNIQTATAVLVHAYSSSME